MTATRNATTAVTATTAPRWDIFAKVVDNYGDAGVCWRLARELAASHGFAVTLWLDDLAALARIAPGVDPQCGAQRVAGVALRRWTDPLPSPIDIPDVVVEGFGCGLPDAYTAAMAQRAPPPAWFVLEYLSAEAWVDGAHGLASPHPRLALPRRFWFPGFTTATGGLLRERGLFAARDAFRADPAAVRALWSALGAPPPEGGPGLAVSLFCYPNPTLTALLDAWADGDTPVTCVVPEGVAAGALDVWTRGALPHPRGAPYARGRLTLAVVPFVAQDAYDRLLWACDVNFVRGEDSFVRAQWAARPFVWHIYPQAEGVHRAKLAAFLDRYVAGLDAAAAAAVRRFWRAWNGDDDAGPIAAAWLEFAAVRPQLLAHGATWAGSLAGLPELADGLAEAARNRL
jgi:uncharacterized repeat protein (TIGR03837 family)